MIHMIIMVAYGYGWFLLIPPVKETNIVTFEIDVKSPYVEWQQHAAFDTARECEHARDGLRNQALLAWVQKSEQEASKKDSGKIEQEEDLPSGQESKALAKLRIEMDAAISGANAAGCWAHDFRASSKECQAKSKDARVKISRYTLEAEKERQKKESPAETEKRWEKFDKTIADLRNQFRSRQIMSAPREARCISSDMLTSEPKR